MGANFSRYFVESAGNTITAANYNGEFDNILTNLTPAGIDDMSGNTTAYRDTVDPGESGTESLPTSLEGEVLRLRKLIVEITGKTYWYESPARALSGVVSGPESSTDNALVRWDGTDGRLVQNSGVTVDDSNNMTTDGTVTAANLRPRLPDYEAVAADTSQVIVPASSTNPARVIINSVLYTNTSDATCDLDTSGRNGLDTGAKAANTLYYLYAIPPTSETTFDVICSATGPGTGPSGFANFRYLGSFVTASGGATVIPFTSAGGVVRLAASTTVLTVTSNDVSATEKTIGCPATAKHGYYRISFTGVNSASDTLAAGPTSGTTSTIVRAQSTTVGLSAVAWFEQPFVTATKIFLSTGHASTTASVACFGWTDSFDY